MKKQFWFSLGCVSLLMSSAGAQTMIEEFEYASDDELLAAWLPSGNTQITLSDEVSPRSSGKTSMRAEFNFPSSAWATETIRGITLPETLSITPEQYLTFRLKGDPAFATSDFHNLYLYAYDEDGNFGRWGTTVPATSDWQIYNFQAGTIQQPWDSTALPDLSRINRFALFQYGSEAAIEPYTATIYIDDLMVRNTPLTEFPLPSSPRSMIDDFESYANDAALQGFYSYQVSPAATVAAASLQSPGSQGSKALKLAIDFTSGQYPWGSVRSSKVPAFSFPTNAVISLQFKGDPSLAEVADAGTSFWLSFYDTAGNGINYIVPASVVTTNEWITLEASFQDFSNTGTVDVGNLVQWRILIQGWTGTAESSPLSGTFYVDNIRMILPSAQQPSLALTKEGQTLKLTMDHLTPQETYDLRMTTNFISWSTATSITATASTATWAITNNQSCAFYQLIQK